jgi:hypothetical protein
MLEYSQNLVHASLNGRKLERAYVLARDTRVQSHVIPKQTQTSSSKDQYLHSRSSQLQNIIAPPASMPYFARLVSTNRLETDCSKHMQSAPRQSSSPDAYDNSTQLRLCVC